MSNSEIAIGIDLGTSNSCVSVLRDGKVEVLPNAYGEPITASVVAMQDDGAIVVGNAAKANVIHDPQNTVSSSKRLMGRYYFSEEVKKAQAICSYEITEGENHGVRVQVRDEQFSPPEIGAMVLRELKSIAEARLGQPVTKAVITVPANFNDNQRQATKDAGRIAGLEVLRILNEPTAAAVAYGFGRGLNQQVAIYDLGGGTFDVSVLEIGRDIFEVLSTCGDTFLGGDDFDDRLIDLLADEFLEQQGVNLRNDRFALEKLKVAAENAKKTLSEDDSAEIRIPDIVAAADGKEAISLERTITAEEFSQLVTDLMQRTFKVCDEAMQQAGVIARDLDGVILVGGPTRLPMIRDAVKTYFQQEPKTDVDPDQVVAMGAAIHAATLVDSDRDAFLLDVTPLSLRIGVAGGLAESIIERNTPVPIEQTRTFTTFQDNQETVVIRVYQGESRAVEDNELLGQFEFSGFKKARRGEVQIEVTFEIDADGIVAVRARDPETGQEASTRITLNSGLSDSDIDEIIEQRREDRLQSPETDGTAIGSVGLVSKAVDSASIPTLKETVEEAPSAPSPLPAPDPAPESAPTLDAEPELDAQPELDVGDELDAAVQPPLDIGDDEDLDAAPALEVSEDLGASPDIEVAADLDMQTDPILDEVPAAEVAAEPVIETQPAIEVEVAPEIEVEAAVVEPEAPTTAVDGVGASSEPFMEIELEDPDAEAAPLEVAEAESVQAEAYVPASEAPTDELRAYDDGVDEEIDLLPEIELEVTEEVPASEEVTVTPLTEEEAHQAAKTELFEPAGTDLTEMLGDDEEIA